MNQFSKKLSNFTSLAALLGLAIFCAFLFSMAIKAQTIAAGWIDEADLLALEATIL